MQLKRRLIALALSAGAVAAIAAAIGTSAAIAGPTEPEVLPIGGVAPFAPLLPVLPVGSQLLAADGRTHPDGTGDFDHFYRLPDGTRLHVWQTTRSRAQLGAKDPLAVGTEIHDVRGTQWVEATGFSGAVTTLTGTIGGIIVSIDSAQPAEVLISYVESLK